MTLGQKIKELRESRGMLQRKLASKLEVGDGFLSKVERDQKVLKREHLRTISEVFNYPISALEALWLGKKLYEIMKEEDQALEALKVVEMEIKYKTQQVD
mgnify:CR=1 FL=1